VERSAELMRQTGDLAILSVTGGAAAIKPCTKRLRKVSWEAVCLRLHWQIRFKGLGPLRWIDTLGALCS